MRVKDRKITVAEARDHLLKLRKQYETLVGESREVDPQLATLQEKIIDAVIAGDSKAQDYRLKIGELQARQTEIGMALVKLKSLIVEAELDLQDAQKAALGGRYTELAKTINVTGNQAVEALKVALALFDAHEIASEELRNLSSEMKRLGVPFPEIGTLIGFRRANEKLDEALVEIAAGTLDWKAGTSILDSKGIPGRVARINARKEEISKNAIAVRNGEV